MKQTPAEWLEEPVVPRWAAYCFWLFGVLIGFGCYYRGHQLWPDIFPDAVDHTSTEKK